MLYLKENYFRKTNKTWQMINFYKHIIKMLQLTCEWGAGGRLPGDACDRLGGFLPPPVDNTPQPGGVFFAGR